VAYPFLSDEWEAEVRRIRAEYRDQEPPVPLSVRINMTITDVPFGAKVRPAHVDTSAGAVEIEVGHLDRPDVTLTLEWSTARNILVGGDPQAVLAAFLGGRIKVDGDIAKLLELQSSGVMTGAGGVEAIAEAYGRIRAITE
jgi:hypothetical protein